MNEIITKDNIKIEDLIYKIRGKQVMLDSDLAMLYGCKNGTKSINLAVKRHINRFPERFMFRLTEEESKIFWF
ncbi:MAG: ORF6N domain-containing protein [Bacilli bacterium]